MSLSRSRWWGGPLDVEQLARIAVHRVRDAAAELAAARELEVRVETTDGLIAASFAAIDHLRINGRAPRPWAEFSGFFAVRDGWVRLHGNYPHHAAVLREVLGVDDRAGLERQIARRDAAEVEAQVSAAGGIAVAALTEEQWRRHPHAVATAEEPWSRLEDRGERSALNAVGRAGPSSVGRAGPSSVGHRARSREDPGRPVAEGRSPGGTQSGPLPLVGVRVLDLTRVIAGPTCTQLLACLGADVLRIDPPHRPEILDQHLSTGMGKSSAVLDLRRREDADRLCALAGQAEVILDGYRPGALERLGFGTADLEQLAPQAVIVSLSAWGEHGPWGRRAGFDSIVQATTGIAMRCGTEEHPGALPVQALDHATGHLMAAHILEALARCRAVTVRVNLLGAARTLLDLPALTGEPSLLEVPRSRVSSEVGVLDAVPPPLTLDGRTLARDVGPYGAARAEWIG